MKILTLLALSFLINASTPAKEDAGQSVPPQMPSLRTHLLAIQPYLVDPSAFTDDKNASKIKPHLKALATITNTLESHQSLTTPGFKVSAQALQNHLELTYEVFKKGDKKYALRMARASLGGCSSCHTQVSKEGHAFWNLKNADLKGSLLSKADFWFTLRHYAKAEMIYDRLLRNFGSKHNSVATLDTAIERNLTICLRIKRDLKDCESMLRQAQKNKSLPTNIRQNINLWVDQVEELKKAQAPKVQAKNAKAILSFARKHLTEAEKESLRLLDDKHIVTFLYTSGLLSEFVNRHPQQVGAEHLYWLAFASDRLHENYFFDHSDLYLKECIEQFPKTSTAKRCFKEFKTKATLYSTGSSGVHMTEETEREIQRLSNLIKAAQ